jgi:hypothetical protein
MNTTEKAWMAINNMITNGTIALMIAKIIEIWVLE